MSGSEIAVGANVVIKLFELTYALKAVDSSTADLLTITVAANKDIWHAQSQLQAAAAAAAFRPAQQQWMRDSVAQCAADVREIARLIEPARVHQSATGSIGLATRVMWVFRDSTLVQDKFRRLTISHQALVAVLAILYGREGAVGVVDALEDTMGGDGTSPRIDKARSSNAERMSPELREFKREPPPPYDPELSDLFRYRALRRDRSSSTLSAGSRPTPTLRSISSATSPVRGLESVSPSLFGVDRGQIASPRVPDQEFSPASSVKSPSRTFQSLSPPIPEMGEGHLASLSPFAGKLSPTPPTPHWDPAYDAAELAPFSSRIWQDQPNLQLSASIYTSSSAESPVPKASHGPPPASATSITPENGRLLLSQDSKLRPPPHPDSLGCSQPSWSTREKFTHTRDSTRGPPFPHAEQPFHQHQALPATRMPEMPLQQPGRQDRLIATPSAGKRMRDAWYERHERLG